MSFELLHEKWGHEGGTKDYDVWIAEDTQSGRTLMIRRWGKVGTRGAFKKQIFASARQAKAWIGKARQDKFGHGYFEQEKNTVLGASAVNELHVVAREMKLAGTSLEFQELAAIGLGAEADSFLSGTPGPSASQAAQSQTTVEQLDERPALYGSW